MVNMKIEDVIEKLTWKFAKSMPQMPHWYTVRDRNDPEKNELYETLYWYVRNNSKPEKFWRKTYWYARVGKYKYWVMTDNVDESIIINRAEVKDGSNIQGD